jgi:hypothetical protein
MMLYQARPADKPIDDIADHNSRYSQPDDPNPFKIAVDLH